MSEMIERVARVIWEAHRAIVSGEEWEQLDGFTTERYRSYARAAIQAMREPTEEMKRVCYACESTVGAWEQMIDEALK